MKLNDTIFLLNKRRKSKINTYIYRLNALNTLTKQKNVLWPSTDKICNHLVANPIVYQFFLEILLTDILISANEVKIK